MGKKKRKHSHDNSAKRKEVRTSEGKYQKRNYLKAAGNDINPEHQINKEVLSSFPNPTQLRLHVPIAVDVTFEMMKLIHEQSLKDPTAMHPPLEKNIPIYSQNADYLKNTEWTKHIEEVEKERLKWESFRMNSEAFHRQDNDNIRKTEKTAMHEEPSQINDSEDDDSPYRENQGLHNYSPLKNAVDEISDDEKTSLHNRYVQYNRSHDDDSQHGRDEASKQKKRKSKSKNLASPQSNDEVRLLYHQNQRLECEDFDLQNISYPECFQVGDVEDNNFPYVREQSSKRQDRKSENSLGFPEPKNDGWCEPNHSQLQNALHVENIPVNDVGYNHMECRRKTCVKQKDSKSQGLLFPELCEDLSHESQRAEHDFSNIRNANHHRKEKKQKVSKSKTCSLSESKENINWSYARNHSKLDISNSPTKIDQISKHENSKSRAEKFYFPETADEDDCLHHQNQRVDYNFTMQNNSHMETVQLSDIEDNNVEYREEKFLKPKHSKSQTFDFSKPSEDVSWMNERNRSNLQSASKPVNGTDRNVKSSKRPKDFRPKNGNLPEHEVDAVLYARNHSNLQNASQAESADSEYRTFRNSKHNDSKSREWSFQEPAEDAFRYERNHSSEYADNNNLQHRKSKISKEQQSKSRNLVVPEPYEDVRWLHHRNRSPEFHHSNLRISSESIQIADVEDTKAQHRKVESSKQKDSKSKKLNSSEYKEKIIKHSNLQNTSQSESFQISDSENSFAKHKKAKNSKPKNSKSQELAFSDPSGDVDWLYHPDARQIRNSASHSESIQESNIDDNNSQRRRDQRSKHHHQNHREEFNNFVLQNASYEDSIQTRNAEYNNEQYRKIKSSLQKGSKSLKLTAQEPTDHFPRLNEQSEPFPMNDIDNANARSTEYQGLKDNHRKLMKSHEFTLPTPRADITSSEESKNLKSVQSKSVESEELSSMKSNIKRFIYESIRKKLPAENEVYDQRTAVQHKSEEDEEEEWTTFPTFSSMSMKRNFDATTRVKKEPPFVFPKLEDLFGENDLEVDMRNQIAGQKMEPSASIKIEMTPKKIKQETETLTIWKRERKDFWNEGSMLLKSENKGSSEAPCDTGIKTKIKNESSPYPVLKTASEFCGYNSYKQEPQPPSGYSSTRSEIFQDVKPLDTKLFIKSSPDSKKFYSHSITWPGKNLKTVKPPKSDTYNDCTKNKSDANCSRNKTKSIRSQDNQEELRNENNKKRNLLYYTHPYRISRKQENLPHSTSNHTSQPIDFKEQQAKRINPEYYAAQNSYERQKYQRNANGCKSRISDNKENDSARKSSHISIPLKTASSEIKSKQCYPGRRTIQKIRPLEKEIDIRSQRVEIITTNDPQRHLGLSDNDRKFASNSNSKSQSILPHSRSHSIKTEDPNPPMHKRRKEQQQQQNCIEHYKPNKSAAVSKRDNCHEGPLYSRSRNSVVVTLPPQQDDFSDTTMNQKLCYIKINDKTFICRYCNKVFTYRNNCRRHYNQAHALIKKIFQCGICGVVFNRSDNLNSHTRSFH